MSHAAIEAIFELYEQRGARHYGESVSQIEHALQCAQLAVLEGAGDSLVAAALLHDIGHLLEADNTPNAQADGRHEVRGATALRGLFGPDVVQPIALHVAAKRYLCATEAGYIENLSDASRQSLRLQGGPLSAHQARRFENIAYFADALRLRRYDEDGKLTGTVCNPLRSYGGLLRELCVRDAPEIAQPWNSAGLTSPAAKGEAVGRLRMRAKPAWSGALCDAMT